MHKLALAIATIGIAGLLVPAPAFAGSGGPTVTSQLSHFAECLALMFTNPAEHALKCSPGHEVFVSSSTGFVKAPCKHEE